MKRKSDEFVSGRGAQSNPHNRFEKVVTTDEGKDGIDTYEGFEQKTKFIEIFPKTILNEVKSPDVGMEYSVNPYQGCEHGCTYCYARPTHEYWGYSAGMDFERVILVKKNAAELLREALRKKSWKVKTIVFSGNTDCYQPCERDFGITRELLQVCLDFKQPVGIITKNVVMQRDLDLIEALGKLGLIGINISLTTLDESLRRKLEPRTATSHRKLELIQTLSELKIPVNAMIAPVIPGLNDHEIMEIAKRTSEAGASGIHYQIVRLNGPNGEIFEKWLNHTYPDRAAKVLNILREMHGGAVSDSQFGRRMSGEGAYSLSIKRQFELAKNRYFRGKGFPKLRTDLFQRPPENGQLTMF